MKLLIFCVLLLALGAAASANPVGGSDVDQSRQPSGVPQISANPSIGAVLTANRHDFAYGAPVDLSFTISNHSKSSIKYQFNSSQKYDVVIVDINGATVWTWSKNKVFGQLITSESIAAGQSATYVVKWPQRDNNDHVAPPGVYTATATLLPMARVKVSGNLLSNPNNDPVNIGMPMMDGVQTGAIKINNTTPSVNAKTVFVIGSNN